ncbi:hypothetical protein AB0L75_36750 [Streptomyces sp. NPDC052101]|uniref:hypothetical protein n=1 Tax=Streptomyces sp. NPDC052101 TaxID=3155763 RepID=UPI00342A0735
MYDAGFTDSPDFTGADGDLVTPLLKMKKAEAAMDKAESRAKTFGSYDPSSLNYHTGQVRFELSMLAERKLQIGRLEGACEDWHGVLDDYRHVQSGRCDDRVKNMVSLLKPHQRNLYTGAVYERGREMTKGTAA